ncbi:MAG: DUF1501 domain-containing protein [Pseudomonadales bacterium]|jgi:uncharacterized protein (DUF1501 family)
MSKRVSRRQFLKTAAALQVVGAASPFALNLATIGSAAAQQTDGYRALVCLFLYGGNDHTNTVIPYDAPSHAEYFNSRTSIALPRDRLTATSVGAVAQQGGREFALHPSLVNVSRLYREGNAAVVANVGPLIVPTSKTEYQQRLVPLPPKLFSHSDQQSAWQAYAAAGENVRYGWGGTLGDQLADSNLTSAFTGISASGNAVWLSGRNMIQYQVSTSGALTMNAITKSLYGSAAAPLAYRNLVTLSSRNLFENAIGAVNRRSIETNEKLRAALPPTRFFTTPIPTGNSLAAQLNVVARMIAARNTLGLYRQVFLVTLGGFDNHANLLTEHARRMATLDSAINAFWSWLGQLGLQSDVTLFTASDFGRTLTSNGDGSDHGWGSHHFVIGGGVAGGTIYGHFPPTAYGTVADIGQGRLLPGFSVDQLAATMGRWLGVADSNMSLVVPNIDYFDTRYLPLFPV